MFNKQSFGLTLVKVFFVLGLIFGSTGVSKANAEQSAAPQCSQIVGFDRNNFSNPTKIDNLWLPMVPGTQITLEGTTSEGIHSVVFTVTDLTKVIDGVSTLVIWDRDFSDGELVEAELAFFAQDNAGNVWNLGEYPEEYDQGKFTGAPSTWISGVAGAIGGIHMLAAPHTGTGYYLQGFSPAIDFMDCAKVFKTGEQICVLGGCYENGLVTAETSPLEQGGGYQIKYHVPGIGVVQVGAVGDPEAETLVMTHFSQLSKGALATADNEALKLDKHGCRTNDIYMTTCG